MNNQELDEKVSYLKAILLKSLMGLGVLLFAGALYMVYINHRQSQNDKAAELLFQVIDMEQKELATPAQPGASSFDVSKIVAWESSKLEAYINILKKMDEFSGTPNWALAQLRYAKILSEQKKFSDAESLLKAVIDKMSGTPLYYGMASDALGVILENQQKNEDALKVFSMAASKKENPLRALALLGEARLLSLMNKPGAPALYEKVIKEFPETTYSQRAKVLQATVQGGAR